MKEKGIKRQIGHNPMCLMISGPLLHQRTKPANTSDHDNMKHLGNMKTTQNLAQRSGLGNIKIGGVEYWARKNYRITNLAEMSGLQPMKRLQLLIRPTLNIGLLRLSPLLIWISRFHVALDRDDPQSAWMTTFVTTLVLKAPSLLHTGFNRTPQVRLIP